MKLLLDYEEVALHLQYNAKKEFFSNSVYPPNPECKDAFCLERQKEKKEKKGFLALRKERLQEKEKKIEKPAQQNKEEIDLWAIELVEDDQAGSSTKAASTVINSEDAKGQNLEDLMAQLKGM